MKLHLGRRSRAHGYRPHVLLEHCEPIAQIAGDRTPHIWSAFQPLAAAFQVVEAELGMQPFVGEELAYGFANEGIASDRASISYCGR